MRFGQEHQRLGDVLALNRPGATGDHVVVALPSYSVGESLLHHLVDRIPALEHRYLLALLMLGRIEACHMVFVSSAAPGPEVIDYYISLLPAEQRAGVRERFDVVTVPDGSERSVAAKLLDRPDIIAAMRELFAGRPAFIEPWNVTACEVEVARRLGTPINGTSPELWPLGFKSAGRKLFAATGTPTPFGVEDVRTVDEAVAAIAAIRAARPGAAGVVIKHDNSGAGDGNVVMRLPDRDDAWSADGVRRRVEKLEAWYLEDLEAGGVVEELIVGDDFASPSVQVDIRPSGSVTVLATHEQELGGDDAQVYLGCRFPANPAYAAELARYGAVVGARLAELGAIGRLSVDFAAARQKGSWAVRALEVNLRKGGTTHPYAALRNLVPGRYDPRLGTWVAVDGTTRAYRATDNIVDERRRGMAPADVIAAIDAAGLRFDHRTGTGVILHMLSCLAIDGRFGVTAIGSSPAHADELFEAVTSAV
jgi:hypothetical protein